MRKPATTPWTNKATHSQLASPRGHRPRATGLIGHGSPIEHLEDVRRDVVAGLIEHDRLGDAPQDLIAIATIHRITIEPEHYGDCVLTRKLRDGLLDLGVDLQVDPRVP